MSELDLEVFILLFLPFMNNTKVKRIQRHVWNKAWCPFTNLESTSLSKNNWYVLLHSNYNLSEDEKYKPQVTHFLEMKTFLVFVVFSSLSCKRPKFLMKKCPVTKSYQGSQKLLFFKGQTPFLVVIMESTIGLEMLYPEIIHWCTLNNVISY